jgi:hypothetical protein
MRRKKLLGAFHEKLTAELSKIKEGREKWHQFLIKMIYSRNI